MRMQQVTRWRHARSLVTAADKLRQAKRRSAPSETCTPAPPTRQACTCHQCKLGWRLYAVLSLSLSH